MTWFQYSVKVCAWLFAIAAVVWLGVAGYFWSDRLARYASWEKAEATVTEIREEKWDDNMIKYSCLSFTDPGTGESVTVRSQVGAAERPIYPVGDKVEVLFPAGQPSEAVENNVLALYLLPMVFTVAGLGFGLVSIVSFLTFRRFRKRAEAA